jgi:hypothetical protein
MPKVTLRTGFIGPDGAEEVLTEYMCDWPGCSEIAVHVIGVVRELRMMCVFCDRHAAEVRARSSRNRQSGNG